MKLDAGTGASVEAEAWTACLWGDGNGLPRARKCRRCRNLSRRWFQRLSRSGLRSVAWDQRSARPKVSTRRSPSSLEESWTSPVEASLLIHLMALRVEPELLQSSACVNGHRTRKGRGGFACVHVCAQEMAVRDLPVSKAIAPERGASSEHLTWSRGRRAPQSRSRSRPLSPTRVRLDSARARTSPRRNERRSVGPKGQESQGTPILDGDESQHDVL